MEYKTIEIAGLTWMAKNFTQTIENESYNPFYEIDHNCGLFYTYQGALDACPQGWKLPSFEDWKKLANSFGGWDLAGRHLMSYESDFNAVLAGFCRQDQEYLHKGNAAMFWSSTEKDNEKAYNVELMNGFNKLNPNYSNKRIYISVRYIKE